MKCISRLLCIVCAASVFLTGCGFKEVPLEKEYNTYSYHNSFTNQEQQVSADFYATDLCVTNTINFGLEGTYASVAQGGGVFDVTTKEVLYSQNLFKKLYPASTTKIITAYIIIRDCDLNATVTISESAADQASDSSTCGLRTGDHITVNDLLYGLMLNSGNDAAEALAEFHSGSVEAFAEVMTQTAHQLGATNSHFKNPSGLPDKEHYTTVYDMYLIFNAAIQQEKFVDIINSTSKRAIYTNKKGDRVEKTFHNSNRYLNGREKTPEGFEVVGGKTGTTFDAGYCLVLYSKNPEGHDIVSIVFKADCAHNLYLLMGQILNKYAK